MADVLDLDAKAPPGRPRGVPTEVIGVRVPTSVAVWVREQAWIDRCTINAYMRRLIEREMTCPERLPADCRDWLTHQASQCGVPGDPDQALVLVLRHLAERWPVGARLR